MSPTRGTKIRALRAEQPLWDRFDAATKALGTDRSTWLRDAMLWCVHETDAKMPKRPKINGNISGTEQTDEQ